MSVYGIWYSIYAKEFNRYIGFKRSRYEPKPWERFFTLAGCLTILITALAKLASLWKSN